MWVTPPGVVWMGLRFKRDQKIIEISINKVPIIITNTDTKGTIMMKGYNTSQKLQLLDDNRILMDKASDGVKDFYRYEIHRQVSDPRQEFIEKFAKNSMILVRQKCGDPTGKTKIQSFKFWYLWMTTEHDFYKNHEAILEAAAECATKAGEKNVKIINPTKEFNRLGNTLNHYTFLWTGPKLQKIIAEREHSDINPLMVLLNNKTEVDELSTTGRLLKLCAETDEELPNIVNDYISEQFIKLENINEVTDPLDQVGEWNEILRILSMIFHFWFWDALPYPEKFLDRLISILNDNEMDIQTQYMWMINTLMVLCGNAPVKWKKAVSGISDYYTMLIEHRMPEEREQDKTKEGNTRYRLSLSMIMKQFSDWKSKEEILKKRLLDRLIDMRDIKPMSVRNQMNFEKATSEKKPIMMNRLKPLKQEEPVKDEKPPSLIEPDVLVFTRPTRRRVEIQKKQEEEKPKEPITSYAHAVTGKKEKPKSYIPSSIRKEKKKATPEKKETMEPKPVAPKKVQLISTKDLASIFD